ncbi:hypothetical protein V6Z11_A02G123600 [Gossypium hirsutum]
MSGLTLSLVDLEVLAMSGTPNDRRHAAKILPVVRKQHLLLSTLLLCNAAAMEVYVQWHFPFSLIAWLLLGVLS